MAETQPPIVDTPAAPVAAPAAEAPKPVATAESDSLSCQWDKCSEKCTSAEALFVSAICARSRRDDAHIPAQRRRDIRLNKT